MGRVMPKNRRLEPSAIVQDWQWIHPGGKRKVIRFWSNGRLSRTKHEGDTSVPSFNFDRALVCGSETQIGIVDRLAGAEEELLPEGFGFSVMKRGLG